MDKITGYQSGQTAPGSEENKKAGVKSPAKPDDLQKWQAAYEQKQKDAGRAGSEGKGTRAGGLSRDPAKREDMKVLKELTEEVVQTPRGLDDLAPDATGKAPVKPGDPTRKDPEKPSEGEGGATATDLIMAAPMQYFVTPVPLRLMEYTDPSRAASYMQDEKKTEGAAASAADLGEGRFSPEARLASDKKEMEKDAEVFGVAMLQQLNQAAGTPLIPELAQTQPVPGKDLQELVERLVERMMVTDTSLGQKPEIVLKLDSKFLNGAELSIRMEDNQLVVSLRSGDPKDLASLKKFAGDMQHSVEGQLTKGLPNLRLQVNVEALPRG